MERWKGQREALDARTDKSERCWNWVGYITTGGYGAIKHRGKLFSAHRLSYELCSGPIPEKLEIDHLCKNKRCVKPAHLEAVTQYVNNMRSNSRAARNARRTHCVNGHLLEGDNLYIAHRASGRMERHCIPCQRAANRRARARRGKMNSRLNPVHRRSACGGSAQKKGSTRC